MNRRSVIHGGIAALFVRKGWGQTKNSFSGPVPEGCRVDKEGWLTCAKHDGEPEPGLCADNDGPWHACGTVVIPGLPYAPDTATTDKFTSNSLDAEYLECQKRGSHVPDPSYGWGSMVYSSYATNFPPQPAPLPKDGDVTASTEDRCRMCGTIYGTTTTYHEKRPS
jgi:hypothetical protein